MLATTSDIDRGDKKAVDVEQSFWFSLIFSKMISLELGHY